MYKQPIGELIGTFILVFIGCSSVAISTLSFGLTSLLEVALVWGVGVTLAIYTVRNICPAHLNPAVSFSEFLGKKISFRKFILFIFFQLLGAIIAGFFVYIIFNNQIAQFEINERITRGNINSQLSARMFGEFFVIDSTKSNFINVGLAIISEAKGTFVLVLFILLIGNTERKIGIFAPILIGATVTLLILWIAPETQGGFNPARDFGPRIIAYFGGWKNAAFPAISGSFFTVYILAPLLGAVGASLFYRVYKWGYKNCFS